LKSNKTKENKKKTKQKHKQIERNKSTKLNQIEGHKNAKTTSGMANADGKGQASLQILPMHALKNEADSQDEEAALKNTQQAFYVEFNLRQQRNFEMCRIGNQ
jgi:hypothetical protein